MITLKPAVIGMCGHNLLIKEGDQVVLTYKYIIIKYGVNRLQN